MTSNKEAESGGRWDANSKSSGVRGDAARRGIVKAIVRFRWWILYAATLAVVIWWYEIRPARLASGQLQGVWREIEGTVPDERFGDSYFYVDENETWFVHPLVDNWNVHRSRITVRPADNFFVVRRAFGFDYGNTVETEYIVCLKGDALYVLRGLARLESVKETRIEKLRRVESLPDEVRESIEAYLDRRTPAPSDARQNN